MSSYFRIILITLFLFVSVNAQNTINEQYKNDLLIMMALDYEINKNPLQSAVLFEELQKNYKDNFEYLQKTIRLYFQAKEFKKVIELVNYYLKKFPQEEEYLLREYILSSVILNNYEDALMKAKALIKKYKNAKNYLIVGDVYLLMKSYRHAKNYYMSAYHLQEDLNTLISLSDILYNYLEEKETAISYLENYKDKYGCEKEICSRLIRFNQDANNTDKMIEILEEMYTKYKESFDDEKLLKIQQFMVEIYEQTDINKAIKILETSQFDMNKLLTLYSMQKDYSKALSLVQKEYEKTNNHELLGQIAILEYELASDKKIIFPSIAEKFEKALKIKENANYENYYGYLLIEFDIDVKKGLELVQKALKKQPNNYAYMDSVAWGYFKLKECKKAISYIEKVIEQVGLSNDEIKLHFETIKECNDIR